MIRRKEFLELAVLGTAGVALSACSPAAPRPSDQARSDFIKGVLEVLPPQSINGCAVVGVKVAHTGENFARHEAKYRDLVKSSGVVVAEYGNFESYNQDPGIRKFLFDRLVTSEAAEFFSGLEQLCIEYEKPYVVVDPSPIVNGLVNSNIDSFIEGWTIASLIGGLLTRRETAKKIINTVKCLTALTLVDFWRDFPFYLLVSSPDVNSIYNIYTRENILDTISFDDVAYRNIRSGQGLSRLGAQLVTEQVTNATYFAGAAHPEKVIGYAKNPNSLEVIIKELPNRARDLFDGAPEVRLYRYNKGARSWVRDEKFK